MLKVYHNADVVLGHTLVSDRYARLNAARIPGKIARKCVWFAPPNNSSFWPITDSHNSPELIKAAKAGKTRSEVFKELSSGRFDCIFEERFEANRQWMKDREDECHVDGLTECKIGMLDFILEHYRSVKLFFTYTHPTYNLISWLGSEFLKTIGFDGDSIDSVLAAAPDAYGTQGAFPETHYEFSHYRFTYPSRFPKERGGLEYYQEVIQNSKAWDQAK
jgi:hypothetical protein